MTLVRDPDELLTNQPEVKAEITLYPNPADEIVFLRSDTEPLQQVEIMNTLGQIIRNFTLDNTRTEKIAISSLNAGLYLIRVNNDRIFRLVVN
ncbi:T9SS type A sorting domain-containing protein [Aureitalea marina]|uniref:T9SS type A sorting domain-containing protein n=1 Tax=Aureitalea marina TaxID=930804 RepID=UPI003CCBA402